MSRDIEDRLARSIEQATPDMLDSLMSELKLDEKSEPSLRDRMIEKPEDDNRIDNDKVEAVNRRRSGRRAGARRRVISIALGAAAMLALVVGVTAVLRKDAGRAFAKVDLDVNPGIEMTIDDKEKVIEVIPVNKDGEIIIGEMDLKGTDIVIACNALIGSMLTNGYLNDRSNSILVSVAANDAARGQQIEKQLSDNINRYLDNTTIAAAILGQYVEADDELERFAEDNGISVGKAWLIRKLLSSGGVKMTEESLLALSTQELIFLGQERKVNSETSIGTADTSGYIDKEEAFAIALEKAGLDKTQVSEVETETDSEDGLIVYEIEFKSGDSEYEFDINAETGEIISSEIEEDD